MIRTKLALALGLLSVTGLAAAQNPQACSALAEWNVKSTLRGQI